LEKTLQYVQNERPKWEMFSFSANTFSTMASSGIAEHNEARRKAGRAELLAFRKKQLLV
jgi:hypothetical protein